MLTCLLTCLYQVPFVQYMHSGRQYEMYHRWGDLRSAIRALISWLAMAEHGHGCSPYALAQSEPRRVATSTDCCRAFVTPVFHFISATAVLHPLLEASASSNEFSLPDGLPGCLGKLTFEHRMHVRYLCVRSWGTANRAIYDASPISPFRRMEASRDGILTRRTVSLNMNTYCISLYCTVLYCISRMCDLSTTKLRCRVPDLNFYMFREVFSQSNLCFYCGERKSIYHYPMPCSRYLGKRNKMLAWILHQIRLNLWVTTILLFGANALSYPQAKLRDGLHQYIFETGRLNCWLQILLF